MTRLVVTFNGNNGQGNIAVPEVRSGDKVMHVLHPSGADQAGQFGAFVIVDEEIIQVASDDKSAIEFHALIERTVIC